MSNYICYLDILGIKDLAKYNSEKFHLSMRIFQNLLIKSTEIFQNKNHSTNSHVYFFSDCAFLESDDLETLFEYLIYLRKESHRYDPFFYTAAITLGELKAANIGKVLEGESLESSTLSLFKGKEKFVSGTIFQSQDISKVYVLQNNFKGVGVFVDSSAIDKWKDDIHVFEWTKIEERGDKLTADIMYNVAKIADDKFEEKKVKYLAESFYFSSISTNTVTQYYDLKLTSSELTDTRFDKIAERYHNSNVKNKKYGRYFLSYFANWICSDDFSNIKEIQGEKIVKDKILNIHEIKTITEVTDQTVIYKKLIQGNDIIINELKSSAYCFEFLYFLLLNQIYKCYPSYNQIISEVIHIIIKDGRCKKYLTKIDEIPECVLSHANKEKFIDHYHEILNFKSNEKENILTERKEVKKLEINKVKEKLKTNANDKN